MTNRLLSVLFVLSLLSCGVAAQNLGEELSTLNRSVVKIISGESKTGTGFIIKVTPDAVYIVTAAGLVTGISDPKVEFYGGRGLLSWAAVLDGAETNDARRGLAVVRVEKNTDLPTDIIAFQLIGQSEVKRGESLTLVGHSADESGLTSTQRIVSSRRARDIYFDSDVADGYLGGPILVNGKVVGIVASITGYGHGLSHRTVHNYVEDTIYNDFRRTRQPVSRVSPLVVLGLNPRPKMKPASEPALKLTAKPGPVSPELWSDSITGMDFVWVKGGCFKMGCSNTAGDCDSNERPAHKVCVNSFWIGRSEVTQSQWMAIMDSNPSYFKKGPNYPVENVSWKGSRNFIAKLNEKSRTKFRLPTEAEWEYACRSGGKREKYSGSDVVDDVAWYYGNSDYESHPVGTKQPNGLGLYDMSGNVYEWVMDWYRQDFYQSSSRQNPMNTATAIGRVLRGASWFSKEAYSRCANRNRYRPGHRNHFVGFRLVFEDRH